MTVMEIRPHLKEFSFEVEKELLSIWDTLEKIKTKRPNEFEPDEMINFQYRLIKVLNDVSRYYDTLSNTRKALEKHKKKIGFKEFLKQKKEVSQLIDFINFLLVVIRSLGDAYVFLFYSLDREYLNTHLTQPSQSLILPRGIGGIGEMEFVKNFKILDGNIVLFHGITNILRIGDFTLFSMKTAKVTAVGELKSGKPDKSTLNLNLTIIGPKQRVKQFEKKQNTEEAEKQDSPFNLPNKERYEKQIKAMADSFDYLNKKPSTIPKENTRLFSKPKWDIMAELSLVPVEKKIALYQVDRGLILGRYSYKGDTMFDRFMNYSYHINDDEKNEVTEYAMKMFSPGIDFTLAFGQVHFSEKLRIQSALGSKPTFWNPIKMDVLKKIYFGESIYFTMYNVGYLIDEMKKKGYNYGYSESHKLTGFKRKEPEMHYFVSGVPYFVDMITHYLQDESVVIEAIEKVTASSYETAKGLGKSQKTEINVIMD
jgi:hypothetical protein